MNVSNTRIKMILFHQNKRDSMEHVTAMDIGTPVSMHAAHTKSV